MRAAQSPRMSPPNSARATLNARRGLTGSRGSSAGSTRRTLGSSAASAISDSYSRDWRSEEHTSELQSRLHLVCRLLLEKKKNNIIVDHQCEDTSRVGRPQRR